MSFCKLHGFVKTGAGTCKKTILLKRRQILSTRLSLKRSGSRYVLAACSGQGIRSQENQGGNLYTPRVGSRAR
jgi:hypothetical protein